MYVSVCIYVCMHVCVWVMVCTGMGVCCLQDASSGDAQGLVVRYPHVWKVSCGCCLVSATTLVPCLLSDPDWRLCAVQTLQGECPCVEGQWVKAELFVCMWCMCLNICILWNSGHVQFRCSTVYLHWRSSRVFYVCLPHINGGKDISFWWCCRG